MNGKPEPRRGPPYGNQNARKHGFYSSTLSPAEICEFWNIARLESIDPEIAALRVKLKSLLQHDPANYRALRDASRLLAKWYRTKYRLDLKDGCCLKKFIRSILARGCHSGGVPMPPNLCRDDEESGGVKFESVTTDGKFYKTNRAPFNRMAPAPDTLLNTKMDF